MVGICGAARTLARPPQMVRRPRIIPLSRVRSGAQAHQLANLAPTESP